MIMSTVPELFGCMVFDDKVMRARLSADVYRSLRDTMNKGKKLDLSLAKPTRADYRTYYARWPDDPNEPPLIAIFDDLDACRAIVTPAGPEITRPLQAMAKLMAAPWLDTAPPEEQDEREDEQ
jgi:hypothetical protein